MPGLRFPVRHYCHLRRAHTTRRGRDDDTTTRSLSRRRASNPTYVYNRGTRGGGGGGDVVSTSASWFMRTRTGCVCEKESKYQTRGGGGGGRDEDMRGAEKHNAVRGTRASNVRSRDPATRPDYQRGAGPLGMVPKTILVPAGRSPPPPPPLP